MAVVFLPREIVKKMAKERNIAKLVSKGLSLNRTAVNQVSAAGVLSKKQTEKIALKVIKGYKRRFKEEREEGATVKEALDDALNDKKLLIQRVQNETLFELAKEVKRQYRGLKYEWLPSDAETPDPEHQLNYGQTFTVGEGEQPGDRYGCKCGMRIITPEESGDVYLEDDLDL